MSTVTPQYVASSASSWIAMFLSRPSLLRSKHSGSSASVYALLCTYVVTEEGPAFLASSSALRTYGVTFLLYPMYTGTFLSAAKLRIASSSSTVGAPGFSR